MHIAGSITRARLALGHPARREDKNDSIAQQPYAISV
jgi:hypothetical protein